MADEPQTDEPQEPQPEPEPAPEPSEPRQLPDDHPLVKALDTIKQERNELRDKVNGFEDAQKTEQERLTEKNESLSQQLTATEKDAARLRVALRKGLTETQAKRLVGDTEEELEEDADELLASFRTEEDRGGVKRSPQEKLKTGATSDVEGTQTPEELATSIRKARDGGLTI